MRATTKKSVTLPVGETVSATEESGKSKTVEIFVTVRQLDNGIAGVITELRPLLNIGKAADALGGMSESWVRQQTAIPFVRIQNRKMFRQEDIEEFIAKNTRGKSAKV